MNKEKFERILKSDIDCNLWALLCLIKQEENFNPSDQAYGWGLLLQKKGYLNFEYNITEKGLELIKYIEGKDVITFEKVEEELTEQSFPQWCESLFNKIKARIKELTGNKDGQHKNPSKQYLRPASPKEIEEQITKFIRKYNYRNLNRIEEEILRHVDYAININKDAIRDKYVRSVYYFIMKKDAPSELLNKLNNSEEPAQTEETTKQFTIINTKDLFA